MTAYFCVLMLIVVAPLVYIADSRFKFYQKLPQIIVKSSPTILLFLIWDYLFTKNQIWSFNRSFVSGIYILGLPIEEVLFFPSVALSMSFIYLIINYIYHDKVILISRKWIVFLVLILTTFAVLNISKTYTFVVLMFVSTTLILGITKFTNLLNSQNFWVFMGVSTIPFFVINSILTSLPIVTYNPEEILNIRIGTIPVEDFLYNYALLMLYVYSWTFFSKEKTRLSTSRFLKKVK